MTSNIGAAYLNELPDDVEDIPQATRDLVDGALRATLPIEFLNRIDGIIHYNRLRRKDIRGIVDIRLSEVQRRLKANGRDITLSVSDGALDFLASIGYSPSFGARPLARAIQDNLLNPLSKMILDESIRDGETARVEFDAPANRIVVIANHEPSMRMDEDDMSDDDELDSDGDVEIEEVDE